MNQTAQNNASIAENSESGSARQQAVAIILEEHRSLRTVLQMMKLAVSEATDRGAACDCEPFKIMLQYIRTFPDTLHHPKEDDYLFARLQLRTTQYDDVIGELKAQHASGEVWLQRLERSLQQFEAGFPPAFEVFRTTLATYCEYEFQHLNLEERVIIPAAEEYLIEEDWAAIQTAFMSNGDSRFNPAAEKTCAVLYSKISRLTFEVIAVDSGSAH
jgi:hemerythrin-like domain-containing protein